MSGHEKLPEAALLVLQACLRSPCPYGAIISQDEKCVEGGFDLKRKSSKTGECSPCCFFFSNDYLISLGSYFDFDVVVAFDFVDDGRDRPAGNKDADDDTTKEAKVEINKVIPDTSTQVELHSDNTQYFDCAHYQGYEHRDQGDVQVVVELTYRFDESPTIGSEHQDTIGGVHEAHARREQRRENQNVEYREAFSCLYGSNT